MPQKISLISEKEASRVYLAGEENGSKLYILKEIIGEDLTSLYEHIRKVSSPYLPHIYEVSFTDNTTTILEEFVEGKSLADILSQSELPETTTLSLMLQLCDALAPLHESNPPLIHRDIKPENILVTPAGKLKLIDLDAARIYNEESDRDTRLLGTKGYASPEQFGFAQTDTRSDIYSMGILFKELIAHSECNQDTKRMLNSIAEKASMLDPLKRYENVRKMQKDIMEISHHSLPKSRWSIGFGCLTLVLIAVIVYLCCRLNTLRAVDTADTTVVAAQSPITQSQYSTPYRNEMQEDGLVVFLGHPVSLDNLLKENGISLSVPFSAKISSSDSRILSVEGSLLTGWQEGCVTVKCFSEQEQELGVWTVYVTTSNDGVNPLQHREAAAKDFFQLIESHSVTVANMQYTADRINTLQDFITFLSTAGITLEKEELPFLGRPRWYIMPSAQTQLERRMTNPVDVTNLALALLQYDFEDIGVVNLCGDGFLYMPYFYEDGTYYMIDFFKLFQGNTTDCILQFSDLESIAAYVMSFAYFEVNNEVIFMFSTNQQPAVPPLYLSYLNTGFENAIPPLELGLEECYYKTLKILYQKQDSALNVISFPSEDIPEDVPHEK